MSTYDRIVTSFVLSFIFAVVGAFVFSVIAIPWVILFMVYQWLMR